MPLFSQTRRPQSLLFLVFAVSRIVFMLCGVRFETYPLVRFWQFIDPALLRDHFLQSLLYLHVQPPFFNACVGLCYKLFPSIYPQLLQAVFLFLSWLTCAVMYQFMRRIGVTPKTSFLTAAVFMLNPATVAFENLLFYETPTVLLLCAGALLLHRWMHTGRPLQGFLFFLTLSLLVLTRSVFQLPWIFALLLWIGIAGNQPVLRIFRTAALPLLLVFSLYAKNVLLFNSFSTTSWTGFSLAKNTTFKLPASERQALVAKGTLSRLALIEPFSYLEEYPVDLRAHSRTGIPILDLERKTDQSVNFNHQAFLRITGLFLKDALTVIRLHPALLLRNFASAQYSFFLPATSGEFWVATVSSISGYEKIYNLIINGQAGSWIGKARMQTLKQEHPGWYYAARTSWGTILLYLTVLIGGVFILSHDWARHRKLGAAGVAAGYLWINIVHVWTVANLFERGENYRFRFLVDPLVFMLAALLLSRWRQSRKLVP